jgi:hypothetical protein
MTLNRRLTETALLAGASLVIYYLLLAVEVDGNPLSAGPLASLGFLVVAWLLVIDFAVQIVAHDE